MLYKGTNLKPSCILGLNYKGLYIWAALYVSFIHIITRLGISNSFIVFFIYFAMAIPFINNLDKFISLCYIISPITYYYTGTDEGLISIYTIFIILAIINISFKQRINKINIVPFIIIGVVVYISFTLSEFKYLNGAFLLIYIIVVSICISIINTFKKDTLISFIPFLACIQVYIFAIEMICGGVISEGRFSISQLVDYNTFGMAAAQMGIVLITQWILRGKSFSLIYKIAIVLSVIIILLSGSRNALLGLGGSYIIVYMYNGKLKGNTLNKTIKLLLIVYALGCLAIFTIPALGIDLNRYNYIELVQSGGTNRMTIWTKLVPVIIENYFFFGYGPGHYCSSIVVSRLVNRDYIHTHNLFIEAWGELGIVGLIAFLWIIIYSFKRIYKKIKIDNSNLIIFAIFIQLLINCIGEAHFCDIILWIIIGFANCGFIRRKLDE